MLQAEDGAWRTFHTRHIVHLTKALNDTLPPGYYAVEEQSIQIESPPDYRPHVNIPDVGLYRSPQTPHNPDQAFSPSLTPVLEIEAEMLFLEDVELPAVGIYRQVPAAKHQLVTRLELLSPSNKKQGRDYLRMRQRTILSQIHLIELDYLHTLAPIFAGFLPAYPHPEAYPYLILISQASRTRFYGLALEEALPTLPVPLLGEEVCSLDLQAVYNQTYADDRYAREQLDYSQEPAQFDRYSPADQARIRAKMATLPSTP
jgi:hypothetical protein